MFTLLKMDYEGVHIFQEFSKKSIDIKWENISNIVLADTMYCFDSESDSKQRECFIVLLNRRLTYMEPRTPRGDPHYIGRYEISGVEKIEKAVCKFSQNQVPLKICQEYVHDFTKQDEYEKIKL